MTSAPFAPNSPLPASASPLIEAEGLFMNYAIGTRQVPVLRGVDLRIAAGTRVAIAGPSVGVNEMMPSRVVS